MIRYETLLLARTEITHDELAMIESNFDQIFTQNKGSLTSFDRWGKYRLAYPVKKYSYGVYVLARYELPTDTVTQTIERLNTFLKLKCNETVLRYVSVRLAPDAPVTYLS